jgi:hypothetical protein
LADENFVDMCAVCKQGVSKEKMVYQNGRVFHMQCFETQGSAFPAIDPDLAQLSARTRVELVQMKNLKARTDGGLLSAPKAAKKSAKRSKTSKKKPRAKSTKKKTKPSKSKKRASKRRR